MNWKDIKDLIREEVHEASWLYEPINEETNITADNTTFIMRTGVNKNPTKLGLKVQFTPKGGTLDRDTKARLAQVLQSKLNESLRQFGLQASIDTDVPNPWYVDSDNFNEDDYPSIFSGLNTIGFFSPSSINPGTNGDVMVYAEKEAEVH